MASEVFQRSTAMADEAMPVSDTIIDELANMIRQLINEVHRLREAIAEQSNMTERVKAEQDQKMIELTMAIRDVFSVPKINPNAGPGYGSAHR